MHRGQLSRFITLESSKDDSAEEDFSGDSSGEGWGGDDSLGKAAGEGNLLLKN